MAARRKRDSPPVCLWFRYLGLRLEAVDLSLRATAWPPRWPIRLLLHRRAECITNVFFIYAIVTSIEQQLELMQTKDTDLTTIPNKACLLTAGPVSVELGHETYRIAANRDDE